MVRTEFDESLGITAPAVSPAGAGRTYFDSTSKKYRISQDGSPYKDLIGGPRSNILNILPDSLSTPTEVFSGQIPGYRLRNDFLKGVISYFRVPSGLDLTSNPSVTFPFFVNEIGAANADVRMQLSCRYIAIGELGTKAPDETLIQTVSVINTLEQIHSMQFVLNSSLMAASDVVSLHLERLADDSLDTFTGAIAIVKNGRLDFAQV